MSHRVFTNTVGARTGTFGAGIIGTTTFPLETSFDNLGHVIGPELWNPPVVSLFDEIRNAGPEALASLAGDGPARAAFRAIARVEGPPSEREHTTGVTVR